MLQGSKTTFIDVEAVANRLQCYKSWPVWNLNSTPPSHEEHGCVNLLAIEVVDYVGY